MCVRYEGERAWIYIGDLSAYRNRAEAENRFEENKSILEEGMANGWEWYIELNYPTSYESLKAYYDNHIKVGLEYSRDAIEESDAKRLTAEKKEESIVNVSGEDKDAVKSSLEKPSNGLLGTNEMVVAIVAIIAFVVVVVATLVTIVVLVMKKRK